MLSGSLNGSTQGYVLALAAQRAHELRTDLTPGRVQRGFWHRAFLPPNLVTDDHFHFVLEATDEWLPTNLVSVARLQAARQLARNSSVHRLHGRKGAPHEGGVSHH